MYVDEVLSRKLDKTKLKFRNMVDMMNIGAIKQSEASYIILHKNYMAEIFPEFFGNESRFRYVPVTYLSQVYENVFGHPVFEDSNIIVFRVSPATAQ
jgi:hypothetical protein